jgi:hypothetical protein
MNDLPVALGLACDACAHARERLAPLSGYRFAAIVTVLGALSFGRQRPSAKERILHRIVDLVLNRTVTSPSAGHVRLPFRQRAAARQGFFTGAI